jgi:uncharacterized metal-binding protein YceD (DUF177 family)
MSAAEFPRPVAVDAIRPGGLEQAIEAKPAERIALAARFAIPAVESLRATFTVRASPNNPGRYEVEGQAEARLLLTCSVSAEDYQHGVAEKIRAIFISGTIPAHTEDMAIDYEWDDPEPVENGMIDLGELAAQHIFLAIPAYPRKPGVQSPLPGDDAPDSAPLAQKSPFAVLQRLKEHKT